MSKVTFDVNRCKGCGLCVNVCPKKLISLSQEINAKGYNPAQINDQSACIACAFCAKM